METNMSVAVLQRQLSSKTEALLILSQELDNVKFDRDALAVALQSLKKQIRHMGFDSSKMLEVAEENSMLKEKVDFYESRIKDLESDNKCLRSQISKIKEKESIPSTVTCCNHLDKLETLHKKMQQLEQDIQALVDEKQELSNEKDNLRHSLHRLNHYLNRIIKQRADERRLVSIDALVLENQYLHNKLEQLREEKESASQLAIKYKSLLDARKKGKNVRSQNTIHGLVLSVSHVRDMVANGTKLPALPSVGGGQTDSDLKNYEELKCACRALLDSLEDKCAALTQMKKANRLLANRLLQLENMVTEDSPSVACPSKFLLKDYSPSELDVELAGLDLDKICSDSIVEQDCVAGPDIQPNDKESSQGAHLEFAHLPSADLPPDLQQLVENAKSLIELKL